MNLPNKLTILRFLMAPVFMALIMIAFPHHYLLALVFFVLASVTDWADGYLARKNKLITNFGKFLDPIADKMLTTAAFLGFAFLKVGYGVVWITFIVMLREFVVMSVRLIAADNGKVVAANFWGKLKTVMQMVAISTTLAFEYFISLDFSFMTPAIENILVIIYSILLWISAIFTLIAGVTYITDNKEFMKFDK